MKKITFLAFLFFCFNAFITLNAYAKTQLTYSNFFPPTHSQSQLAESWCAEVEKRTNGEVSIKYFPAQALAKAPQTYDAVVNGIADIGMTVLAYTGGRFPISSAIDLPMGYKSGVQATSVANAVYTKFAPKEFDDTSIMYLHAHGPGLINMGSKKVATIEDMKGLKIRTTGASGLVISALGGSPVGKGMGETYELLQKGVVDGSLHPLEANKGWKLGEVVKYVTESYPVAYTTTFAVFMNKGKWAKLSPEIQKTITDINAEWAGKHGEAWDESDKAGIEFLKEKGGEFISLSDEQAVRWKDAMAPVFEDYYKQVEPKGIDGKAVVEFIKANM
jgi:TRAP-type C4-dicarboxylate transport system substrate-binding protein